MATAVAAPVSITDPTLLSSHSLKNETYLRTKQQIDEELPKLKASIAEIEIFSKSVRDQGKVYQEATDPVELTADMVKELKDFLKQYEEFKSTYEKTVLVIENIKKTIVFLTPTSKPWSFSANAPELYDQSKESERICLLYIDKLVSHQDEFTAAKDKLYTLINNTTITWSIQRFCGIVDNGGKPLGWCSRAVNYVYPYFLTPTFPAAKDIKIPELPAPLDESLAPIPMEMPPIDQRSSKIADEFDELFGQ